jgi:ribosomal protein S18 acetylase RimI-like enzyme
MLRIRAGTIQDTEVIVCFQIALAQETENLILDSKTVHLGVQAVFNDSRKGQYWVAEVDQQICGILLEVPEWSDWRNGTVLWIHSVYVDMKFRKMGVFKSLYLHLKNRVQSSNDLRGLRLYVDKRNTIAQNVYQSLSMDSSHYALYEWMKDP